MRKLFPLLAVIFSLQAGAQPYSISFAGDGLSTVKVQNLTSGIVVDVPAGDVLILSTPTGIGEVNNMKSSRLKVYPNPMTDKSTMKILPPAAGDASISVCDMTGKVLTQFKGYVDNSVQEFSLSGIKTGLHLINVQGNGYQFSEKLLSNGKSNGTAVIGRVSNNNQTVAEKESMKDSKGVQANIDMAYNAGERLKYTAESGNNKTVMTDIPVTDKTVTFTFTECKDGDDNNYPVVNIGAQIWMGENLKYLPSVVGPSSGSQTTPFNYVYGYAGTNVTEARATANFTTYGVLYNWPAAMNGAPSSTNNPSGVQGLCPSGWHLPSKAEWTQLVDYLVNETVAGGKLKESGTTHWGIPNTGATNEEGFTALPGGNRASGGFFSAIGFNGTWWSSTEATSIYAYRLSIDYGSSGIVSSHSDKNYGYSIRCLKD